MNIDRIVKSYLNKKGQQRPSWEAVYSFDGSGLFPSRTEVVVWFVPSVNNGTASVKVKFPGYREIQFQVTPKYVKQIVSALSSDPTLNAKDVIGDYCLNPVARGLKPYFKILQNTKYAPEILTGGALSYGGKITYSKPTSTPQTYIFGNTPAGDSLPTDSNMKYWYREGWAMKAVVFEAEKTTVTFSPEISSSRAVKVISEEVTPANVINFGNEGSTEIADLNGKTLYKACEEATSYSPRLIVDPNGDSIGPVKYYPEWHIKYIFQAPKLLKADLGMYNNDAFGDLAMEGRDKAILDKSTGKLKDEKNYLPDAGWIPKAAPKMKPKKLFI